jgi:eukaryotic-like serine/threonine-protein kinase
VLHRDIKPSNLLLDLQGMVWVTDFGLAKDDGENLTHTGDIVGTLSYMAPERFNGVSGPRSDIYSLGVTLYELVTLQPAFKESDRGRLIMRVTHEEPPRPTKLERRVPRDLETIVLKAMAKEPAHRYQSAEAMAEDLRRFLGDHPILARRTSLREHLWRWCRRNPLVAALTAWIGLLVLALVLYGWWNANRLGHERDVAVEHKQRAEQAEVDAADNLKQARTAVDEMYTQVAEKWLAHQPRLEPVQRDFLQKALRFYEQFAHQTSSEPVVRFDSARAYRRVADIQYKLGDAVSAEKAYHQAIVVLEGLVDGFPDRPEFQKELADLLHKLGVLVGDTGRKPDEEKFHRRALVLQRKLVADFPAEPVYRRDLARGLYAFVFNVRNYESGQFISEAISLQQKLAVELASVPEVRAELAVSLRWLGNQSTEGKRLLGQAEDLLEKLVGEFPGDPSYREELADSSYSLAMALPSPDGDKALQKAMNILEKLIADFPSVYDYRSELSRNYGFLGRMLTSAGKIKEAERAYRRALVVGEQLRAVPNVDYFRKRLADIHRDLGDLLNSSSRFPEAEKEYRQLIDLLESLLAESPKNYPFRAAIAASQLRLGSVLTRAGRLQQAEKARSLALTALPILEKRAEELPKESADRLSLAVSQNDLAWGLATDPDPKVREFFAAVAVKLAKKAVELTLKEGFIWNTLGVAYYRAGDWKAAVVALNKSIELRKGGDNGFLAAFGNPPRFDWYVLAMAQWQLGKMDEAREWYEKAVQWMEKSQPQNDELKRFRAEAAELLGVKERKK